MGLKLGSATLLVAAGLWMLNQELGGRGSAATTKRALLIGTLMGAGSSLAWGFGYVARRFGLALVPSPTVGVLIGATITVGMLLAITLPKHGALAAVVLWR